MYKARSFVAAHVRLILVGILTGVLSMNNFSTYFYLSVTSPRMSTCIISYLTTVTTYSILLLNIESINRKDQLITQSGLLSFLFCFVDFVDFYLQGTDCNLMTLFSTPVFRNFCTKVGSNSTLDVLLSQTQHLNHESLLIKCLFEHY